MEFDLRADEALVFYYGSYINLDVLAEIDYHPRLIRPAVLSGWELSIGPLANIRRKEGGVVYGILATGTHAELRHLYEGHAQTVLGETYLPQAVLTHDFDGALHPALCYVAPHMKPVPADAAYVGRIAAPAREWGFPQWYLEHIESFVTI